ncbi:MAG TPA: hypothetical protein VMW54_11545 [Terriglobia bacterium]|nr:hypothetical protein [Terriglobia bacterium]
MARTPQTRKQTIPHAGNPQGNSTRPGLWPKLKLIATRAIFWSYERGSWQYDVIVVVILAFIFLTPARWFHDRPRLQLTDLRHVQGIVEVSHSDQIWVYQLDARLVDSLEPLSPLDATRQLLVQRVHPPFIIKSLQPILGSHDVVLGYTVEVERK